MYDLHKEGVSVHPACSPFYTLSDFMGNLNHREYQEFCLNQSKYNHYIDKPMVRIFPDIHNDTNPFGSSFS